MAVLFTMLLIITIMWHVNIWYSFNHDISNWLKLAGDAPTVERANEFLTMATKNIVHKGLTSGNSAFIFRNPDADLGIWYSQVTGARATLQSIINRSASDPESVSQLERDNALMKIREVLLDEGENGTKVTTPPNMSLYPFQWLFFFLYPFSGIGAIIFWVAASEDY